VGSSVTMIGNRDVNDKPPLEGEIDLLTDGTSLSAKQRRESWNGRPLYRTWDRLGQTYAWDGTKGSRGREEDAVLQKGQTDGDI
jgi:hypothetical protein